MERNQLGQVVFEAQLFLFQFENTLAHQKPIQLQLRKFLLNMPQSSLSFRMVTFSINKELCHFSSTVIKLFGQTALNHSGTKTEQHFITDDKGQNKIQHHSLGLLTRTNVALIKPRVQSTFNYISIKAKQSQLTLN